MSVYILGMSAFYHDSAAALIKDGEIIAATQEERFTRIKAYSGLPTNAINYCLMEAGIEVSQLDYVVFYDKPFTKFERLLKTFLAFAPQSFVSYREAIPLWLKHKLHIPTIIHKSLPYSKKTKTLFVDHHESHAASAFFPSPFKEATILTMDGVGEWATSTLGVGSGNRVTLTHEMRFPHSLGLLYSAFTHYIGFKVNSGEYKLMGLAAYGKPSYVDLILDKLVELRENGSLWLDMSYFNYCQGLTMTSEKFHNLFGEPPRQPESMLTEKHLDLAASVQVVCEEAMLRAARHAYRLASSKNLVMAGGVALNCVANGRILREGPFENLWIQPAAGDAGGALGAALLVWHHFLDRPRIPAIPDGQKGSLIGPQYSNEEIKLFLDSAGATYSFIEEESVLLDRIASLMANEKIVGWFQGRMEFGPRALGCRSIIGDARSSHMQRTMNLKIKFRESFRPFAPCILREHVHEYFEMRLNEDSPYMLLVAPVKDILRTPLSEEDQQKMSSPDLRIRVAVPRSIIPAVTHVDYSARVQTVDEERHGRFYRLMLRFYALTGCPVIVNTSFNIRGEPIVCSPAGAFRCFMATDIDCLVLENFVLLKQEQPKHLHEDAEVYRSRFELD